IAYRDTKAYVPPNLKDDLKTITLLLRNVANNVNQIAHSSNVFHDADLDALLNHLKTLDDGIKEYVFNKVNK
ncbi:MAG: plasmid mobilization relaxosome protein MobC, partial [Colwellia sp.]